MNKAVLEPRVSPAFAITYLCNHCNIRFENTSKYVDTLTLFSKNLNQRSLTPRWPLTPCLLRSHVWLYPRIIVSKSHGNTSMYVDTVINFANYHIHTYTYIHTTYRISDHIVSYWTQFRRDKKAPVAKHSVQNQNMLPFQKSCSWLTTFARLSVIKYCCLSSSLRIWYYHRLGYKNLSTKGIVTDWETWLYKCCFPLCRSLSRSQPNMELDFWMNQIRSQSSRSLLSNVFYCDVISFHVYLKKEKLQAWFLLNVTLLTHNAKQIHAAAMRHRILF